MALEPYIRKDLTFVLRGVSSRDALFRQMTQAAGKLIPSLSSEALFDRLVEREERMATSTPEGVAFPHALAPEIDTTVVLSALTQPGVDFGVPHHPESDLIFCMFGPTSDPWEHVRLLARLARIVRTEAARGRLRAAQSTEALFDQLVTEDRLYG